MFLVQYRCLYREHWYDDSEWDAWNEALARATQLLAAGRRARIVCAGRVVWAG